MIDSTQRKTTMPVIPNLRAKFLEGGKMLIRPATNAEAIRAAARKIATNLQGREPTPEESAATDALIERLKSEGKLVSDVDPMILDGPNVFEKYEVQKTDESRKLGPDEDPGE